MRRFSQRNPLVTLSDINITPLLDLAFVLLIIFVITTPLLDPSQSVNLKLPVGGQPDKRKLDKNDIRTVEIVAEGTYILGGQKISKFKLEEELIKSYRRNPNLAVDIRGDQNAHWRDVFAVFDICIRNGISQVSPRASPVPQR
jgi:biopolymer transport protein ExbD